MSDLCRDTIENWPILGGFVATGVNDSEAIEEPEFVPTRYELLQIAKYWRRTQRENDWLWFLSGVTSSSWNRQDALGGIRIKRIIDILGPEAVHPVLDEVESEFLASGDPTLVDIFLHGDQEHHDRVRSVMHDDSLSKDARRSVFEDIRRDVNRRRSD